MNRLPAITLCFLFFITSSLHGQQRRDTLSFWVMSYNVENLFDCRHDSLKADYEFLPTGKRRWTYGKYHRKLTAIARVIAAAGGGEVPALVALQEVENDSVLRDLTRRSPLRTAGYRYVMTHSPDRRGIDVALLYDRSLFRLLSSQSISLPLVYQGKPLRPTRDILHATGQLLTGDTLDLFVCHFPSRVGNSRSSTLLRRLAAERLSAAVDSVFAVRSHPQLLVMGDFNADCHFYSHPRLHHLLTPNASKGEVKGSYKFRGSWQLIDHLIVSDTLLNPDAPFHCSRSAASVFQAPFLFQSDKTYGGRQPFRTGSFTTNAEGYSDHLPVTARFTLVY
jgi:endonuclease/exonuclease/phosphatase family metal-dependent hydrolase